MYFCVCDFGTPFFCYWNFVIFILLWCQFTAPVTGNFTEEEVNGNTVPLDTLEDPLQRDEVRNGKGDRNHQNPASMCYFFSFVLKFNTRRSTVVNIRDPRPNLITILLWTHGFFFRSCSKFRYNFDNFLLFSIPIMFRCLLRQWKFSQSIVHKMIAIWLLSMLHSVMSTRYIFIMTFIINWFASTNCFVRHEFIDLVLSFIHSFPCLSHTFHFCDTFVWRMNFDRRFAFACFSPTNKRHLFYDFNKSNLKNSQQVVHTQYSILIHLARGTIALRIHFFFFTNL